MGRLRRVPPVAAAFRKRLYGRYEFRATDLPNRQMRPLLRPPRRRPNCRYFFTYFNEWRRYSTFPPKLQAGELYVARRCYNWSGNRWDPSTVAIPDKFRQ